MLEKHKIRTGKALGLNKVHKDVSESIKYYLWTELWKTMQYLIKSTAINKHSSLPSVLKEKLWTLLTDGEQASLNLA